MRFDALDFIRNHFWDFGKASVILRASDYHVRLVANALRCTVCRGALRRPSTPASLLFDTRLSRKTLLKVSLVRVISHSIYPSTSNSRRH